MPDSFVQYPIRGKKFSYSIQVKEHLLSQSTEYQQIDIYDTECFGKILTLDNHIQLSTFDESAYHESLVHIPLLSIPGPKRALVVGGGDGGVLRELCLWSTLEQIDMVEIDAAVVEVCKRYLPELNRGAFEDPRVSLHIRDAFEYLELVECPYDLIVMDITDTYEGEEDALSERLFTEKFHLDLKNALTEEGILVMQADNHVFCPSTMAETLRTLKDNYEHVGVYQALVPSFGGFSGYCWASKGNSVASNWPGAGKSPYQYLNETTYALAMQVLSFTR